jgi:feruloyl esterase
MLATYPDLFAAGAIVAGLPYGAAASVQEAFSSMSPGRSRRSEEWGDLVRQASKHRGPWPRVSVWHGTADTTVSPANADEIVKQWTAVHGLPSGPTRTERVNEYSRHVWCSETGDEVIESFTVTGMAHGTPLATGDADDQCGSPGDFMLDVGISSSFHIAKFWGLTGDRATVTGPITVAPEPEEPLRAADGFGRPVPEPDRAKAAGPRPGHSHGIIMRALEAAGLMRRQD